MPARTLRPSTYVASNLEEMRVFGVSRMKKQVVEVGARFGKLTVLGFAGSDSRGNQLVDVTGAICLT